MLEKIERYFDAVCLRQKEVEFLKLELADRNLCNRIRGPKSRDNFVNSTSSSERAHLSVCVQSYGAPWEVRP